MEKGKCMLKLWWKIIYLAALGDIDIKYLYDGAYGQQPEEAMEIKNKDD